MASEKNFSGIAVNERLYDAGLLEEFFNAANKKDRYGMISVLMLIELERSEAEKTADTILKSHAFSDF